MTQRLLCKPTHRWQLYVSLYATVRLKHASDTQEMEKLHQNPLSPSVKPPWRCQLHPGFEASSLALQPSPSWYFGAWRDQILTKELSWGGHSDSIWLRAICGVFTHNSKPDHNSKNEHHAVFEEDLKLGTETMNSLGNCLRVIQSREK